MACADKATPANAALSDSDLSVRKLWDVSNDESTSIYEDDLMEWIDYSHLVDELVDGITHLEDLNPFEKAKRSKEHKGQHVPIIEKPDRFKMTGDNDGFRRRRQRHAKTYDQHEEDS